MTAEGEARIVADEPPASANPTYLAKYQGMLDSYELDARMVRRRSTPSPIRIRPTRWRL